MLTISAVYKTNRSGPSTDPWGTPNWTSDVADCLPQDIECIERVTCRYTKRLPGLKLYPYKDRLQRLDLTTLELGRLHVDFVWYYKIVFGLVDVNFDDFFILAPLSRTRAYMHKMYQRRCSTNVGSMFISIRCSFVLKFDKLLNFPVLTV